MGLLEEVTGPALQRFAQLSTASQVGTLFLAFIALSVVVNVANQLLFKNPNEPPVVFHLFPIIGSTITYGMDPPRFFVENRNKVSPAPPSPNPSLLSPIHRPLTSSDRGNSLAMFSPSFSSARRPPSTSAPTATSSS